MTNGGQQQPPDAGREAEIDAEAERSRERIEAGGIPLNAERRLRELREDAGAKGVAFTSDLSVSGFALCHQLGLTPVSQVMGSSIYQMGYQGTSWPMMMGGAVLQELEVLSQAWNEARRLALNRLEQEAVSAGADAVVGVEVRTAAHDWAEGAIEYAVLGTAVRRAGVKHGEHPALTELSVADYAKLLAAGVEPLGIVAWTSVFFATVELAGIFEGGVARNYEVPQLTQGIYSARERVMERLGYQAQQRGASGIVGVRVGHSARRQEVGGGNRSRAGMVITFDAIGTAVRDAAEIDTQAPKMTIDLTT